MCKSMHSFSRLKYVLGLCFFLARRAVVVLWWARECSGWQSDTLIMWLIMEYAYTNTTTWQMWTFDHIFVQLQYAPCIMWQHKFCHSWWERHILSRCCGLLLVNHCRCWVWEAVFCTPWKNDVGWSWYSDTTSDMTAAETWNPWFYLQARGEKSQGRGGAGCFSGPGLFVSTLAWCLLSRHVDHLTLRVSFQRHHVRFYLP